MSKTVHKPIRPSGGAVSEIAPGKRYLNPHTVAGVDLSQSALVGASSFIVHECGFVPHCANWHHRNVQSPFWRLIYNFAPGNHIVHAGRPIALAPEVILVLPEQVKFDGHGPAEPPHLWLHFSLTREFVMDAKQPLEVAPDPLMRSLFNQLREVHGETSDPLRLKRLYHLSYSLLHALFARLGEAHHQTWPEKIYDLLGHIQNHPGDDLSNPVLARRAGMSVGQFIRWVKGHTGMTPAQYGSQSRNDHE